VWCFNFGTGYGLVLNVVVLNLNIGYGLLNVLVLIIGYGLLNAGDGVLNAWDCFNLNAGDGLFNIGDCFKFNIGDGVFMVEGCCACFCIGFLWNVVSYCKKVNKKIRCSKKSLLVWNMAIILAPW